MSLKWENKHFILLKYTEKDVLAPLLQLLKKSLIFNALNKTIPTSKDIDCARTKLRMTDQIVHVTCGISGFSRENSGTPGTCNPKSTGR